MNPSLRDRASVDVAPTPDVGPSARGVIFHNHRRFVSMAERWEGRDAEPADPELSSFDLSRFANGMAGAWSDARPGCGGQKGGPERAIVDVDRANPVFVGIDFESELPPMWRLMLGTWIRKRARAGDALVFLEDGKEPGTPELVRFFSDLAKIAEMDFVRVSDDDDRALGDPPP